jgi:hypothetical protein
MNYSSYQLRHILLFKQAQTVKMSLRMYTLVKLKESETKMHARDIVRREQEQIELLMAQKAAAKARVKQLEKENEILLKRIKANKKL